MTTDTGPGERAAPHAWGAGPRYAVGRRRKWGPAPSVAHIVSHPATWLDNAWFAVCGDLLRNPMTFTPQPSLPVCRNCQDRAHSVRRDSRATR